jgi:hypothetical protein
MCLPYRICSIILVAACLTEASGVAAFDSSGQYISAGAQSGYRYRPEDQAIVIENGTGRFNRPLYSAVERNWRLIAMAGDRPEFMLMQLSSTKNMTKLANIKLGLADGPWLEDITPVLSRHDCGLQQYQAGGKDDGFEVAAVRAIAFDGLLLRVKCHGGTKAPLVLAIGGRGEANYDQNPLKSAFNPEECRGTSLVFADNVLTVSGKGTTLQATGSAPMRFMSADPDQVVQGPQKLLGAPVAKDGVAALAAEWPENGELYFILTPDAPDSDGVKAFRTDPAKVFATASLDNHQLASSIGIETPDPFLNTAFPSAVLGYHASWNAPTFRHGAIAWHDSFAGWRATYGGTVAGWHDQVQSHVQAFYHRQGKDGRLPTMLGRDSAYNMGEVLVDMALYDYEWTGDLEPLRDGGFDAIARHLAWGEKHIRTPDGLYENFLNAWNTDFKWSNGGGGTIASAYYWRANRTMAVIAARLGKDPAIFKKREDEIAKAMRDRLWSEKSGVFGEYRDSIGRKLLHESPDLSSIYTPIDLGFCDPFEAHRMLRFALRRFETLGNLPRGGELIYSSEWLPNHYSTRGIYTAETIHTLLAMYLNGQAEAAEPLRRGIDGSFFAGPGPGSTGYEINPDGTYKPHTDFTDTMSMYVRNVVEGLFGIRMQAPDKRVTLQPSFPLDWEHAAIRTKAVEYRYQWKDGAETMEIKSPRELAATVRLRARRAQVDKITVNGKPARYRVEPGIGIAWIVVEAPPAKETQVRVAYGEEPLPEAVVPNHGLLGETHTFRVDRGRIESVRRGSREITDAAIAQDGKSCSFRLPAEAGVATWFVLVRHGDIHLWIPAEVDVRPKEPARKTAAPVNLQPKPVDITKFLNQRLAALHRNSYTPRIEQFAWSGKLDRRCVQANGRSWWEAHEGKRGLIRHDTSRLTAAKGTFLADERIPFKIPAEGKDAVFTSLYDNFPDRIEIPVNQRGRTVAVLAAASIPLMQTRMDNGRIRVNLSDGSHRDLVLRDPETIDDWLGSGWATTYALNGHPVPLGMNTHGHLYQIDLGDEHLVKSVELETFTNETMIGLLGITVMTEGESGAARE